MHRLDCARIRGRPVRLRELEIHRGRQRRRECDARRAADRAASQYRLAPAEWLRALPEFEVELFCDGTLMDRGRGSNVLEGPLSVIRHVTRLLEKDPDNPPLAAGE